jgi:hypothetical protein
VAVAASSAPAAEKVSTTRARVKHDREVLRFFAHHHWLLTDPRYGAEARRQISLHKKSLTIGLRTLAAQRRRLERRQVVRQLAAVRLETPTAAICRVFEQDCQAAVRVARCESRLHIDARNGQYLGLFQMGAEPRRLYGHGATARAQATAARRYFIASGRDWSPWSCKPW